MSSHSAISAMQPSFRDINPSHHSDFEQANGHHNDVVQLGIEADDLKIDPHEVLRRKPSAATAEVHELIDSVLEEVMKTTNRLDDVDDTLGGLNVQLRCLQKLVVSTLYVLSLF